MPWGGTSLALREGTGSYPFVDCQVCVERDSLTTFPCLARKSPGWPVFPGKM